MTRIDSKKTKNRVKFESTEEIGIVYKYIQQAEASNFNKDDILHQLGKVGWKRGFIKSLLKSS